MAYSYLMLRPGQPWAAMALLLIALTAKGVVSQAFAQGILIDDAAP